MRIIPQKREHTGFLAAFGKTALTATAAIALAAVLCLSTPLWAGEVLMSRAGFDNWLWQTMFPREQMLDRITSRTQALESRLAAWEYANLHRIILQPDSATVEFFGPGGAPAGVSSLDVPPRIVDGRTMVPLRFIGEALGAEVDWNGESRQVIYTAGDRRIVLTLDQKTVLAGERIVEMDTPPMIIQDRTMVPVRFVSQWLGAVVKWNEEAGRVEISYRQGGFGVAGGGSTGSDGSGVAGDGSLGGDGGSSAGSGDLGGGFGVAGDDGALG